jgi:NhaP-type Na+/H+ or K+/H+ antiporter
MQPRICNSVIWILVGLAILLLMFHGRIGLLAVVLPISLLLACAMMWSGNHNDRLTRDPEKR